MPGSPLDPRHRGTNQLLRDGAILVESARDVLAVLGAAAGSGGRRCARPAGAPRRGRPSAPAADPAPAASPVRRARRARSRARLGPAPLAVDELIRECDAAGPDVQAALLELELAGRIDRHPGNRVCLRAG